MVVIVGVASLQPLQFLFFQIGNVIGNNTQERNYWALVWIRTTESPECTRWAHRPGLYFHGPASPMWKESWIDRQSGKYWFTDCDRGCPGKKPRALITPPTGGHQDWPQTTNPAETRSLRSALSRATTRSLRKGLVKECVLYLKKSSRRQGWRGGRGSNQAGTRYAFEAHLKTNWTTWVHNTKQGEPREGFLRSWAIK